MSSKAFQIVAVASLLGLMVETMGLGVGIAAAQSGSDGVLEVQDPPTPVTRLFGVDHHVSFRFRPELVLGGDLGPGESVLPPPLDASTTGGESSEVLAWASVRLRYEPVFRLGTQFRVHLGLDALDNLILGSTHSNAGGDFATGFYRDSAAPPSTAGNAQRDAVRVRYAYASWRAFEFLDIVAGRRPDHFGLGLQRHGGDCADCDNGTIVDAFGLGLTLGPVRIEGAWEFTATGVISALPDDLLGTQALDVGWDDDVTTWVARVGSVAPSADELAARQEAGADLSFDWQLFSAFTDQRYSSSLQPEPVDGCDALAELAIGQVLPWYCTALVPREAFFWRPGFWFALEARPDFDTFIRAELEFAGLIGDMSNVQTLAGLPSSAKDFLGFGLALETELTIGALSVGLDSGFATGDDGEFLGYEDGNNFVVFDDLDFETEPTIAGNRNVNSFWFNRDYRLDLILFRQVIGGVTNAYYIKPWISGQLLDSEALSISARLDVLYAGAVDVQGTPGDGSSYGVEFDAHLLMSAGVGFEASLSFGLLLPMDALADHDTGASPEMAFATRLILGWRL